MTNLQRDPTPNQASGITGAQNREPLTRTTQTTTMTTNAEDALRTPFTTLPTLEINPIEAPCAPPRNRVSDLETNIRALEGVTPELAPSAFVSQNYEALVTLMQEEVRRM